MSPRMRGRLGLALLLLLVALSAGYSLLSRLPAMPACPLGPDVQLAQRTVCERTLGGLWRSVFIGLSAGGLASFVALALALLGRQLGPLADWTVEKSADLLFAIPDVLVLIGLGFAVSVGKGGENGVPLVLMVGSLAAIGWAAPTRMIQNRLRSLERQEFIFAAHALGLGRWRILTRHLLPFAWDYLLAIFLLRVPAIILTESTISFLGFGLAPSEPSLGSYLGTNYESLLNADGWRVVLPAWMLLVSVVIAFQWTGQGVLARAEERAR